MDKIFLGSKVGEFLPGLEADPITRVELVDENGDIVGAAGENTGRTLTATNPDGTNEMAESILSAVGGYVYKPYEALDALLDPAAEIGDGVTIAGVYSVLAQTNINFDGGLITANIAAPTDDEIEDEYPYISPIERQIQRNYAVTRSLITKKAEEITLKVENLSENVGHTLRVAADGVTITDADGKTVTISGGQIDAKTINTQDLILTGVISFGDLSDAEDIQKQIDAAGGISASEASSIASTLITNTLVSSPTIQGATIKGGAYYDLLGYGKLMLSYSVDDGEETTRDKTTPWLKFLDAGNGDAELFEIVPLNKKSSSVGMLLGGTLALFAQDGVIYPSTAWDFSSVKATFG